MLVLNLLSVLLRESESIMSRKFIDDHIELLSTADKLPADSSQAYRPGHMFRDAVSGVRYVNKGTRENSIFSAPGINRYRLEEAFRQTPGINGDLASATEATRVPRNRDFEVVGTNMTSALVTFADGGGITLTTAGADGDQGIVTPHLDTKQTAWAATKWNTNDRVIFETTIKTGSVILSNITFAGLKLTNDPTTATDDNQTFFRFQSTVNDGKFQAIDSNAGTDTATDTGITVALSTTYVLSIRIDSSRVPRYYINHVLVATGSALAADVDLIPYVGVDATGFASAKSLTVRHLAVEKDYND